jgi:hypothetical protein
MKFFAVAAKTCWQAVLKKISAIVSRQGASRGYP